MTEQPDEALRKRWLGVPFSGCHGLVNSGQKHVREGQFAATVLVPPKTKLALEMLLAAMRDGKTPSQVLPVPTCFPSLSRCERIPSSIDPTAESEVEFWRGRIAR